jgi:hypothetical protein
MSTKPKILLFFSGCLAESRIKQLRFSDNLQGRSIKELIMQDRDKSYLDRRERIRRGDCKRAEPFGHAAVDPGSTIFSSEQGKLKHHVPTGRVEKEHTHG